MTRHGEQQGVGRGRAISFAADPPPPPKAGVPRAGGAPRITRVTNPREQPAEPRGGGGLARLGEGGEERAALAAEEVGHVPEQRDCCPQRGW